MGHEQWFGIIRVIILVDPLVPFGNWRLIKNAFQLLNPLVCHLAGKYPIRGFNFEYVSLDLVRSPTSARVATQGIYVNHSITRSVLNFERVQVTLQGGDLISYGDRPKNCKTGKFHDVDGLTKLVFYAVNSVLVEL